ncbi:phage tail protein [Allosphingosinicella sp.]|uniref:phage tail protein n=1 Tax=Allosphingosinicella sp. TaxID=2823234 RepID=UPI002F22DE68
MSDPYIGEIRMFAGNFAPAGWMFCQGQTLPISENDALFTLIGTTYGGDGQETFNLPNLASRIPIHMGTGPDGTTYQLGEAAGTEQETLTIQQIPSHTHPAVGSANAGTSNLATDRVFAVPGVTAPVASPAVYGVDTPFSPLHPSSVTPAGGSQPHENTQPFLCINFIISLFGEFPRQT